MAAVSSYDEIVTVLCSNQAPEGADFNGNHTEISISTHDVDCWDFDSILSCQIVKVEANRSRFNPIPCLLIPYLLLDVHKFTRDASPSLVQYSSYFRGLLTGSFR